MRVLVLFEFYFSQITLELWLVEIVFHRFLERVYSLCLRWSLPVAMGIPTVSLSSMQLPSILWCPGTQMRLILR